MLSTFIAVDECVLDDHGSAIDSSELLRLPPHLPEASSILGMAVEAARYT